MASNSWDTGSRPVTFCEEEKPKKIKDRIKRLTPLFFGKLREKPS
jgi:hypothetical protein